ncbi:MAG TPA: Uma2 family endonuclease [Candidatus Acidoferrales bacterium]|nr:Uma2 family endonuclease [Candidatus Acidoferrales bacterium]
MGASSNPLLTVDVQLRRHRFSVEAYDEMVAQGILTSDDRVELLAGDILEMAPIGSRHAAFVSRLGRLLTLALHEHAIVRVQSPVALPPDSQPEPDIAIVRPREDFYARSHPRAGDVLLLIEVADSSLTLDRTVKEPLYAAAGIAELWIVDLRAEAIAVCAKPECGTYTERSIGRREATLTPTAFPEVTVRVQEILFQDG